jgi:probable HAF family extracellular repeat protein
VVVLLRPITADSSPMLAPGLAFIASSKAVSASSRRIGFEDATEWSHGKVIDLGGLPGYIVSAAFGINDAGHAVGLSEGVAVVSATEWRGGRVINLSGLPGSTISVAALGINDAGVVVGYSFSDDNLHATEWRRGKVINLGPGKALGINDAGVVVWWDTATSSSVNPRHGR